MSTSATERRERLVRCRLYLVCPAAPGGADVESLLRAALAGGVDVVQLRDKQADEESLRAAAPAFRRCCDEAGALFIVNDDPELAVAMEADGVHVGQDDVAVEAARAVVGPDRLVGLSTHSLDQIDGALGQAVDYIAVGPVHATPTKPGRSAVGLGPIRHAAERVELPWFAIGGLDAENVGEVVDAGATRVVVVRAIIEARDPEGAAGALRAAIEIHTEAGVGTS